MNEAQGFAVFVGFITLVTAIRAIQSPQLFLILCLIAQGIALKGLASRDARLTRIGHISFTVAVWVGSLLNDGFELWLIAFLAAFTLVTRRVLGHCMFARARGSTDTDDARYDLVYLIPLVVCIARLSAPTIKRSSRSCR